MILFATRTMRPCDSAYSAPPLDAPPSIDARFMYAIFCWGVVDPWVRYTFYQTLLKPGERFGGAETKPPDSQLFPNEAAMHDRNPQETLDRGDQQELPPLPIMQGTEEMDIPLTLPQRFAPAYRSSRRLCTGGVVSRATAQLGTAPRPGNGAPMKEFVAAHLRLGC